MNNDRWDHVLDLRPGAERLLSQPACDSLLKRLEGFAQGGGKVLPTITSWWNGELRWGRNRVTLSSDRRDVRLVVKRQVQGVEGEVTMNQQDDASLAAAVRAAELAAARKTTSVRPATPPPPFEAPLPALPLPKPTIWSDTTYNLTPESLGQVARSLATAAVKQGLLSAGYLEVRAGSVYRLVNGTPQYDRFTQAQCSMTVRDPSGKGSGWGGGSSYDWAALDPMALAQRALQKCVASQNPVALEPGRYTVILEPQAVADLLEPLVGNSFTRPRRFIPWAAEYGGGPFQRGNHPTLVGVGLSKLGLKVVDERLTLQHDPADPLLGVIPEVGMRPVTWIDHGVLTNLVYPRDYAINQLGENAFVHTPNMGYRLTTSGETTSVEDMIASTKRGLLVTRFWGVSRLDQHSVLSTGLTRDGLWLIENGKISRPVKNFRFVESPMFVLNQLEQIGVPVPVFRPVRDPDAIGVGEWEWGSSPVTPALVPALKARDFSFTAMVDAV